MSTSSTTLSRTVVTSSRYSRLRVSLFYPSVHFSRQKTTFSARPSEQAMRKQYQAISTCCRVENKSIKRPLPPRGKTRTMVISLSHFVQVRHVMDANCYRDNSAALTRPQCATHLCGTLCSLHLQQLDFIENRVVIGQLHETCFGIYLAT
jgi:hypothetical protein